MTTSDIALLVLEDGTVFKGRAWGAKGRTLGEIVFSTGMTGYQETLTDPSYHRQIVVMTAPHIGNTGVNDEDPESSRIWVAGFVVRDAARRASNWRSRRELEDELISQGIVGIADVDTRAITRHIRERGAMRAGIFSGDALPVGAQYLGDEAVASLVRIVAESPAMSGQALAAEVSTDETYVVEPLGDFEGKEPIARVVAVDLGIKSRTPYHLAARGARVYVVPSPRPSPTSRRSSRTVSSSPTAPVTHRRPTARSACCAPFWTRASRTSVFASVTSSSAAPSATAPTSWTMVTAASTSRCRTWPRAAWRSPLTTTASQWTLRWGSPRSLPSSRAATGASRSRTSASTTVSSRVCVPWTFPLSPFSTTPRQLLARTTASCSSIALFP